MPYSVAVWNTSINCGVPESVRRRLASANQLMRAGNGQDANENMRHAAAKPAGYSPGMGVFSSAKPTAGGDITLEFSGRYRDGAANKVEAALQYSAMPLPW